MYYGTPTVCDDCDKKPCEFCYTRNPDYRPRSLEAAWEARDRDLDGGSLEKIAYYHSPEYRGQ
jgi:hypothetical protein